MKRTGLLKAFAVATAITAVAVIGIPALANHFGKAAQETSVPSKLQAGRYWERGPVNKTLSNNKLNNWTISVDQNGHDYGVTRRFDYRTNFPDLLMSQKFVFYTDKKVVLIEEVSMVSDRGQDVANELKAPAFFCEKYDKIKLDDKLSRKRAYITRIIVMDPQGVVSINGKAAHESIALKYWAMFTNVEKTCDAYLQAQEELEAAHREGGPSPKGDFYERVARALRPGMNPAESPSIEPQPFMPQILGGAMPKPAPKVYDRNRKGLLKQILRYVAG